MATAFWSEAMTVFVEGGFIDGFEYQPDALLNDFVAWGGNSQRSLFAVGFGDIDPADRCGLIVFCFEQFGSGLDGVHAHAVECFPICAFGHVARLAFEAFVGHDVQRGVVQQMVQLVIYPLRVLTIFSP